MKALTVLIGLAMLGVAADITSGWARPTVVLGVPAVLLALPVRLRSSAAVTAAVAALAVAAGSHSSVAVSGEGLLIFSYLLFVEAIGESQPFPFILARLAAGIVGSGAVALALLPPTTPSTILILTGLTAIAAAYALALPRRARARQDRR